MKRVCAPFRLVLIPLASILVITGFCALPFVCGQEPKADAPISAMTEPMRRFAAILADAKTDESAARAADETLEAIDRLIELARRQEESRRRQARGTKTETRSSDPNKKADDKDADDKNSEGKSNASPSDRESGAPSDVRETSGTAPEAAGLFYGKGRGEVERSRQKSGGDWGALPAAERERILNRLGEKFPSYYRLHVERYFRKMAGENDK